MLPSAILKIRIHAKWIMEIPVIQLKTQPLVLKTLLQVICVLLKMDQHALVLPLDGIWQMIKKLWLPPLILQFKIQTQHTVTQMMEFLATQIMVSDAILLIIIIFAQLATKLIFNLFLIVFQMTEFHVIKIKDKFATLQLIWTLIGAILWILHKVVQHWMESHVSVPSMVFL